MRVLGWWKSSFYHYVSTEPAWRHRVGCIVQQRCCRTSFLWWNCGWVNYLEMLRDVVVPQLRTRANFAELFFQQDGAPPHYALAVRDSLNQTFPQRLFGRRGSIEWPSHSPDLTPMDFFFWGVVKNKVYERNPHTVDELRVHLRSIYWNWCRSGFVSCRVS